MLKYIFLLGFFISIFFAIYYFQQFDFYSQINLLKNTNIIFLIIAVFSSYVAFYIRSLRWSLLLNNELNNVSIFSLFKINCSAAFVNIVFPIRLGELFKALYGGELLKVSKSFLLGTIIIERFTDLIILSLVLIFFLNLYSTNLIILNLVYLSFGLTILIFTILFLIYSENKTLIKLIGFSTMIFSNEIRFYFLSKIWKIIKSIKNQDISNIFLKYLFLTIIFWVINLIVIYLIIMSININFSLSILLFILSVCFLSLLIPSGPAFIGSIQIVIILGLEIINIDTSYSNAIANLFWLIILPFSSLLGLFFIIKDNFKFWQIFARTQNINKNGKNELNSFLLNYFSGEKISYLSSKFEKITKTKILKEFKGGSLASTLLIEENSNLNVLKIQDINKSNLSNQYEWIKSNQSYKAIPKVNSIYVDKKNEIIYYKLPFYKKYMSMYDYLHRSSLSENRELILNIINNLFDNHYIKNENFYNIDDLNNYIEFKLFNNIVNFSKNYCNIANIDIHKDFIINNINYFSPIKIINEIKLNNNFKQLFITQYKNSIHGDLSFENILIKDTQDFLFLDPNPINILNTKENDLAKLLQSSSGGYEFLQNLNTFNYNNNVIQYTNLKSLIYENIDQFVRDTLKSKLTKDEYLTLDFYLAVHFARMLPYKTKINHSKSIIYFAQSVIFLNIFYDKLKSL